MARESPFSRPGVTEPSRFFSCHSPPKNCARRWPSESRTRCWAPRRAECPASPELTMTSAKNILLVEADHVIEGWLCQILRAEAFNVSVARSLQEASMRLGPPAAPLDAG